MSNKQVYGAGEWSGPIQTQWLPDGRSMILLQSVTYTDTNTKRWVAPAGSVIDGASIPWFMWRAIGSPFCGLYRNASVVHDVYCKTKTRDSVDVHKMFYDAMLTSGVRITKAKTMWLAVRTCGPRFKGS